MRVLEESPPCAECGYVARVVIYNLGVDDLSGEDDAGWRRHLEHTTRAKLASTPIEVLRQWYDVSPIRKQFGQWAVTTYGLECLTDSYAIDKARLKEPDWERHMSEKTWVLMEDFSAALKAARTMVLRPGLSPRSRFRVMQRDGFKCRLCGRAADDGVKLEVDHRVPVSKGGASDAVNLWTLCWECNRGKADALL